MKFTEKDFEGLIYNPFDNDDKDIYERWPRLITVFPKDSYKYKKNILTHKVMRDKIIKYILLLYQIDSPLMMVDNMIERKILAAKLANLDINERGSKEDVRNVIAGKNLIVNNWIINFCRLQRNIDFTEYVTFETIYYEQLERSVSPEVKSNATELSKVLNNIQSLRTKLVTLRKSLLADDDRSRVLIDEFMRQVEEEVEQIRMRREDIAGMLMEHDREDIFAESNPYGEGYKVSENMNPDINEEEYRKLKYGE